MYIAPNSKIKLLKNIPLDNRYEHTLWFGDTTSQKVYFAGKAKYSFDDQTYIRFTREYVTVNIKADDIYDCNYLMYQNTSFGNKWFYGFVKSIEYISNDVSRVYWELDVMQTWLHDYKMGQCLVEREHVSNDAIGANTTPEPISFTDDYYIYDYLPADRTISTTISMCVAFSRSVGEGGSVTPSIIGGVPNATDVYIYHNWSKFKDFMSGLNSTSLDSIVFATTMPYDLAKELGEGRINTDRVVPVKITKTVPRSDLTSVMGNYTPKNNKCYVYPYNYLNCEGSAGNLQYLLEKNDGDFNFTYFLAFSSNPTVYLKCDSYFDRYNGFAFGGYPQIPWTTNVYSQWQAVKDQNQYYQLKNAIAGAGISGIGGIIGQGVNNSMQNSITDLQFSRIPPTHHGSSDGYANIVSSTNKPLFTRCHLNDNALKILDDYFTRFGYQVNRVKTPARHTRPSFNYIKTNGCTITGSVPADDMQMINTIHDKGVTYWSNHGAVGDYSVNNK